MGVSRRFFVVAGALSLAGCSSRLGHLPQGENLVFRPLSSRNPAANTVHEWTEAGDQDVDLMPSHLNGPTSTSRYVDYYGEAAPGTLILNHANREVFFVEAQGRAIAYPVAVGREGVEAPADLYTVFNKRVNPTWTPTSSMRERDPSLPASVAGGTPQNPLGTRAIYLALNGQDSYLRFHGTNAPSSIGSAASSGCFRMHNHDVEDLYSRVHVGARVNVIRGAHTTPGIQ